MAIAESTEIAYERAFQERSRGRPGHRERPMQRFGIALLMSLVVVGCGGLSETPTSGRATVSVLPAVAVRARAAIGSTGVRISSAARPTLKQVIGQKLVVAMDGVTPSADLLGRIARGEVGGVILRSLNITTRTALIALTRKLRSAAAAGRQPRLLIAVDQEGGPVKRIPWAPPTLSAPQMGDIGLAAVARAQGASTGVALRGLGINVDFGPVADVPGSAASFMYRDGRTFSFGATRTAVLAAAFASGLESKGVLPTMKHFPGIGLAARNTDFNVVTVRAPRSSLAPGLRPYRMSIADHIPLIMLSNATYTAYDPLSAAGWSHAVAVTLLRHVLGFTGVSITDSLNGTARARGLSTGLLAVRAARAGTDMILLTGSEASTRLVCATLLGDAKGGSIPFETLRASYDRIVALKAGL